MWCGEKDLQRRYICGFMITFYNRSLSASFDDDSQARQESQKGKLSAQQQITQFWIPLILKRNSSASLLLSSWLHQGHATVQERSLALILKRWKPASWGGEASIDDQQKFQRFIVVNEFNLLMLGVVLFTTVYILFVMDRSFNFHCHSVLKMLESYFLLVVDL